MKKSDIPVVLLAIVEKKIKAHSSKILEIRNPEAQYFYDLRAKVDNEKFYFKIYKADPGKVHLQIKSGYPAYFDVSPFSRNSYTEQHTGCAIESLGNSIDAWVSLLQEVDQIESIYDDRILANYIDEISSFFKTVEHEDTRPLDLESQLFFDGMIDQNQLFIEESSSIKNEDKAEILIALTDINIAMEQGTILEFKNKFILFLAKVRRSSFKTFKTFFSQMSMNFAEQKVLKLISGDPNSLIYRLLRGQP